LTREILIECVQGRLIEHKKLSHTCRFSYTYFQIYIIWPMPPERSHRSRCSVNVDAPPTTTMHQAGV